MRMSGLVLASLLAACTSPSSPSPAGLQPQIFLNSFNSQLRVNVGLQGTAEVDVDATFRGQTVAGTRSTLAAVGYLVLFDLDHPIATDEPVVIDVDGIAMTITAPPQFDDLQVPQSISRNHPGTISWATTSPDWMQWLVEASTCAEGYGSIAPSAASVTFAPTDWLLPDGGDPTATCATTVRLRRDRTGTVDPAFQGSSMYNDGSLMFEQVYDVTFTSTP